MPELSPSRLFSSPLRRAIFAVAVLLCCGALLYAASVWQSLNTSASIPSQVQSFLIRPGEALGAVARRLEAENAITSALHLKVYARLSGKASKLKAGEFQLRPSMTPIEIIDHFIEGKVRQYQLAIVEGWSFKQLRAALEQAGPALEVKSAGLSVEELMRELGYPDVHPEGQFLPDTYSFPRGSTDIQFLRRAYQAMQDYLSSVWDSRDENLPIKTPYDALILASIVEKETGAAEERPLIAGVFMSRLRINMRLQTDPTIIYGLGDDFDGNIRRKHLRQDTPYNTYTRHGLTPTPIAMPGRAAIDAVLHPADTEALYFVSRGDGTHKFSKTLQEHEAAVDKYQRKRSSK